MKTFHITQPNNVCPIVAEYDGDKISVMSFSMGAETEDIGRFADWLHGLRGQDKGLKRRLRRWLAQRWKIRRLLGLA